ncbi:MAG: MbnP family protein [Catalinimonas sp.]
MKTLLLSRAAGALLFFGLLTWACGDDGVDPDAPGRLTLRFDHRYGADALRLNEDLLAPAGDTISVESFKYYVSNVRLRNRATGETFIEPDSYHLITFREGEPIAVEIEGVTPGTYTELAFAIGVDNGSNTSIDRTGDLDPTNDMAWNWRTGYKFLLLEGRYRSDTTRQGTFVYHIGSDANYRVLTYNLNDPQLSGLPPAVTVEAARNTAVQVRTDVRDVFEGFRLDALNFAMFDPVLSKQVADNYAEGTFTLVGVDAPTD